MSTFCEHDEKFYDCGGEGTSHCVYCRCLAAESEVGDTRNAVQDLLGLRYGVPWLDISADDVDSYIEWVRTNTKPPKQ